MSSLHSVSPVIGADTIPAKIVNRKANEIKGLPTYPYASASFPTVTFDNENKSTPEAKSDVFDYIEGFYNQVRKHSHLDQMSLLAFEQLQTGS